MTDLKERLRARIVVNSGAGPLHIADKTCHEAADRIEQLEAENERLREALKKIEQGDDGRGPDYIDCYECADKHEIARQALKEQSNG